MRLRYCLSSACLCGLLAPIALAITLDNALIEYAETNFGHAAKQRLLQWQQLMEHGVASDDAALDEVNRFFNETHFVSDQEHWGRVDYWATPVEMLITGGGDCEDYSIAKYFTLKQLGIPDKRLRLTYVKAVKLNQAHMVLAYYPEDGGQPFILDNLTDEILPASERKDLSPVYSFNGEGLWLSRRENQTGLRIGNAKELSRWVDVNKRLIASLSRK